MNQKDGWFLGLLALAFLYLDSSLAPRAMSDDARPNLSVPSDDESPAGSRLLPVPVTPGALPALVPAGDVCPRNRGHAVALRADGAMWCRGCDEAFYPHADIWNAITSAAA
jgi:hypothetical protein